MISNFFSMLNILLTQIDHRYLFKRSVVVKKNGSKVVLAPSVKIKRSSIRFRKGSDTTIGEGVKISDSVIILENGAKLIVGKGVSLDKVRITVKNGTLVIGHHSIVEGGYSTVPVPISVTGEAYIGHHNRIRGKIKVQYGGVFSTGEYTNINEECEIRCDQKIEIGDFVRISYKCIIWDTNTHNLYSNERRRELVKSKFPVFGYEFEKPKTKPIYIGNDCWIGREAAILKGSRLNANVIVGYRTVISNLEVEENTTIVSKIQNIVMKTPFPEHQERMDSEMI